MEVLELKARLRNGTGKSYTRKTREQGWIPAVYYGHDKETKHIEVDAKEFQSLVRAKKTKHLINLKLDGGNGDTTSIIKDIQRHVLLDNLYFHIDFQSVSMDEKIGVECPVVLTGTPIGVREEGGILNQIIRTISIECLPGDIPENLEIDVSELRLGKSIHVSDLSVEKFEIKASPEDVVAVVVQPQAAIEEVEKAEGEEGEAVEGEEGEAKDVKEGDGEQEKKDADSGDKEGK